MMQIQKIHSRCAAILMGIMGICSADTLRISELADRPGEGVDRMAIVFGDQEQIHFVKQKVVIADADVERAWPDPARRDAISVKLNAAGATKMKETTARMRHGHDRLAIIVDGRLVSAPVVQMTLDRLFVISGLHDLDIEELDNLARRMSGLPPRAKGERVVPEQVETIPYSEEEYQQRKAMREKMGIFHLDSLPGDEELNGVLRKGITREEVVGRFGEPSMTLEKTRPEDFSLFYHLAPEKRPENPKHEMLPDGFKVDFAEGKLVRWSSTYSNAQREVKTPGMQQPLLKAILPEMDMEADDFDMIAFVEGIVIPDPQQEVNAQDLADLVSIITMLAATYDEESEERTLSVNCDFMKILSHQFAEVAALLKTIEGDKVRISALSDRLSPYARGEKEFP